jgi:hypothetical protein
MTRFKMVFSVDYPADERGQLRSADLTALALRLVANGLTNGQAKERIFEITTGAGFGRFDKTGFRGIGSLMVDWVRREDGVNVRLFQQVIG